jgi:tetratricopeptide (TPR) repeat protein
MDGDRNTFPLVRIGRRMLFSAYRCRPARSVFRLLVPVVVLLGIICLAAYFGSQQFSAWRHYRAAQQAVERRDFRQAQADLADCLQVWSSSAETYYEAARVARRAGNYDDAEMYLAQAQRLGWVKQAIDLERTLAHVQRGELADRQDLGLLEYVEKNKDKSDPEVPILLEALSKGYIQSYYLPQARTALTKWLELEPHNTQALLWRGGVLSRMGNAAAAEKDFRQAVESSPNPPDEARLRLAETLLQQRKPQEALEQLVVVQQRQPDNPLLLYDLALCKHDLQEPAEAQAILDGLLDQRRNEVQELAQRPQLGQPFGPEEDWWRQAIELAPFDLRQPRYILTLFALILTERARLAPTPAAQKAFLTQAVLLSPNDATVTTRLADCLEHLGDPEAKKYRERSQQIDKDRQLLMQLRTDIVASPHDPEPRCRAAEILMRNRQPEEALRWLESALREDANYAPAHEALARYYESIGDRGRAAEERDRAHPGSAP